MFLSYKKLRLHIGPIGISGTAKAFPIMFKMLSWSVIKSVDNIIVYVEEKQQKITMLNMMNQTTCHGSPFFSYTYKKINLSDSHFFMESYTFQILIGQNVIHIQRQKFIWLDPFLDLFRFPEQSSHIDIEHLVLKGYSL